MLRTIHIFTERTEMLMGDLSLLSILATAAENLNIEPSEERLRITHEIYLMNNSQNRMGAFEENCKLST